MELRTGDVAVVTGAASGIGLALVKVFLERGMRVVMADLRPEGLVAAADKLGDDILAVPTDVSDPHQMERLASVTFDAFGRVDVICNNAGISGPRAPLWEQDLATWTWTLDVLLMGVVRGIRAFVPAMINQGRGHVLNMASIGGLIPLPGRTPYNAAKHAVVALSETLQVELVDAGAAVGVTVVCPGHVDTPLAANSLATRPSALDTWDRGPRTHGSVITARDVAQASLSGIEQDQLHVLTNADTGALVRARVDSLLADLP